MLAMICCDLSYASKGMVHQTIGNFDEGPLSTEYTVRPTYVHAFGGFHVKVRLLRDISRPTSSNPC